MNNVNGLHICHSFVCTLVGVIEGLWIAIFMMNNKTLIASLNTFIALALRFQTFDFKYADTCIFSVF